MRRGTLGAELSQAVADGVAVDWDHLARTATEEATGRVTRNLRLLSEMITAAAPASRAGHDIAPPASARLAGWILGGMALIQIGCGLAGYAMGWASGAPDAAFRHGQLAALLGFALGGVILLWGGRGDQRAIYLGVFFLIVGSAFASVFLRWVQGPWAVVRTIRPDAFLPLFLWLFVREFPRVRRFSRIDRVARRLAVASAAIGTILVAVNLLLPLGGARLHASWLGLLGRNHEAGVYWVLVFGLMLPALPIAHWRSLAAGNHERRRLRLFTAGLLAGGAPVLLLVLAQIAVPPLRHRLTANPVAVAIIVFGSLASIPFTTAYAVLFRRVLDVRLVVRRAYRRVLAHQVLITACLLPLVLLAWYLRQHVQLSVSDLVSGPYTKWLLLTSAAGVAVLACRGPLLAGLDRRFFPEGADYRRVLTQAATVLAHAPSAAAMAHELGRAASEICLPGTVSVLLCGIDADRFTPIDGPARPLNADSALVVTLARTRAPILVDPEERSGVFRLLPRDVAEWVVDGRASTVLPLHGNGDALLGLLAVGRGRDERPLSEDSLLALTALARSAGVGLEHLSSRGGVLLDASVLAATEVADVPAMECPACRRVAAPSERRCACGCALTPAHVPKVVSGKFRIESRLGAGGMGVVYDAVDISLGRTVAVKTLPRLSLEAMVRMRREARAMAAVSHPNLAQIFGVETWRGRPLLVVEYLAGGTLARRLEQGRLPTREALEMGIGLASGLEEMHRVGLLHRDIKPGNIGYAADGRVKLLDFGLARLMAEAPGEAASMMGRATEHEWAWAPVSAGRGQIVGTPPYMAPEIWEGAVPGEWTDLWSLAVVLFECIAGRRPFEGHTPAELVQAMRAGRGPLLIDAESDVAGLAAFFETALNAEPARRFQAARAVREALEQIVAGAGSNRVNQSAGRPQGGV
jgi:hypothetical protein